MSAGRINSSPFNKYPKGIIKPSKASIILLLISLFLMSVQESLISNNIMKKAMTEMI